MIQNKIKKTLARIINHFGYDLHRIPDPFIDQKNLIKGITGPVIFDVGAHHGQTSIMYSKLFKNAKNWDDEQLMNHCFVIGR